MSERIDHYRVGKTLGEGFSAKVKLGMSDQDGQTYALKIFRYDNPMFDKTQFKLLMQEVEHTQQLNHSRVVKYFTFKERTTMVRKDGSTVDVAYIAQELVTGGELFDYVANSGAFSPAICKYYFKQMLHGIHHIHQKGFAHRDLKPQNILLDGHHDLKIVDFGFTCPLSGRTDSGTNKTLMGTPGYMAPEILEGKAYNGHVVDLFALGVILFVMYTGNPPFSEATESDPHYGLLYANRDDLFWRAHSQHKPEGFYSPEFKSLITAMLARQPYLRLSMTDVMGHPWLANDAVVPTITSAEAGAEFATRQQVNKAKSLQARQEKIAARKQQKSAPRKNRRAISTGGKVYLSMDEEVPEDCDSNCEIVRLQTKPYDEDKVGKHSFFSTYGPDEICKEIAAQLQEKGVNSFVMSEKTWRLTFEAEKQPDDAQSEEARPENPRPETARIQVEILKVVDQEKFCVNFKRKAGSAFLFYRDVDMYINALDLVNNTSLDEELDFDDGAAQQ